MLTGATRVRSASPSYEVDGRTFPSYLAVLGFVAFALDLYGDVDPPIERAKELVRELRADAPRCGGACAGLR
jgi:hypothetical protein